MSNGDYTHLPGDRGSEWNGDLSTATKLRWRDGIKRIAGTPFREPRPFVTTDLLTFSDRSTLRLGWQRSGYQVRWDSRSQFPPKSLPRKRHSARRSCHGNP